MRYMLGQTGLQETHLQRRFSSTAYIIKCGFGADNQGLQPAPASVLFDRKAARIPHLIIYANRYWQSSLYHTIDFQS
jgi:hypothetical protein